MRDMNLFSRLIGAVILSLAFLGCVTAPINRPPPPEPNIKPSAPFMLPLKKSIILSKYGPRDGRFHTGIDLRVSRGTNDPVLASRAGRVTQSTKLRGYGTMVEILHEDGYSTRYAHLKKAFVKKGDKVRSQETIGLVGRTGRATTEHLHFEILTPKHRFLDPYSYLYP